MATLSLYVIKFVIKASVIRQLSLHLFENIYGYFLCGCVSFHDTQTLTNLLLLQIGVQLIDLYIP